MALVDLGIEQSQSNNQGQNNHAEPSGKSIVRVGNLKTGLKLWSGTLNEEYLPQLRPWSKAYKVYTEMLDDIVIGSMIEALYTPLLSSPFSLTPAANSADANDVANFTRSNLFDLPDMEWEEHVEDSLEFIGYGWSMSQRILEKRTDGKIHLRALVPIGQDTLDFWGPTDDFGKVTSFHQLVDGIAYQAPMESLVHMVFRPRKRNPMGWSLLRSLYRSWYFKKNLETLEAIGIERDVGNAPVAELDAEVKHDPTDIDNLEDALEGFRMDEALYVILPPGVTLTAYGGGNKVYDVRLVIRDLQHLIRQRFFADFLSLGSEQVGTQALAGELTNFFGVALRYIQRKMLSGWKRQLIRPLMMANGIPEKLWPTLDWLPPGDQSLQSLAQAYNTLIGAEVLTPDHSVETRARIQLGLPPISEEDADRIRGEKAALKASKVSGPLNQGNPSNQ